MLRAARLTDLILAVAAAFHLCLQLHQCPVRELAILALPQALHWAQPRDQLRLTRLGTVRVRTVGAREVRAVVSPNAENGAAAIIGRRHSTCQSPARLRQSRSRNVAKRGTLATARNACGFAQDRETQRSFTSSSRINPPPRHQA